MKAEVESFLSYLQVEKGASQRTQDSYLSDLRDFGRFLQEQEHICAWSAVERGVLRRYLGTLQAKQLARRSIARRLSALRTFFRFLEREGLVAKNPLRGLPPHAWKTPARLPGRARNPSFDGGAGLQHAAGAARPGLVRDHIRMRVTGE